MASLAASHVVATAMLISGLAGCAISFKVEPDAKPVDTCVYVSPSLGNDAIGDGTRAHPVATIAHALSFAEANMLSEVCLSGESYREQVTLVSGISIYGGFDQNDPDFPFRRSTRATSTVTAEGFVFDAPDIKEETHLEDLTIVASSTGKPGASTYGVKLDGGPGRLIVRSNHIKVDDGVNGEDGDHGTPIDSHDAANGASGVHTGGGGPAPNCPVQGGPGGDGGGNDQPGHAGGEGELNPGSSGGGGPVNACAVNGCVASGGKGGDGADGDHGAAGDAGDALGQVDALNYTPANGLDGTHGKSGAAGGGGGGGGSGAGAFCALAWQVGGGGGSGGCGGIGGDLGRGGQGGGGSFGIFATGGNITVSNNTIETGKGGSGGNGGNGSGGQVGGHGGGPGGCNYFSGPGGAGGTGGNGGDGGPGGGGGGGPSACLARAKSAITTFEMNSCTTGVAGFGGEGGTNPSHVVGKRGAIGTAAANLSIP